MWAAGKNGVLQKKKGEEAREWEKCHEKKCRIEWGGGFTTDWKVKMKLIAMCGLRKIQEFTNRVVCVQEEVAQKEGEEKETWI